MKWELRFLEAEAFAYSRTLGLDLEPELEGIHAVTQAMWRMMQEIERLRKEVRRADER